MTLNGMFKSFRIALVTSSIRQPRLNPYITAYVHQVLSDLKTNPILPDNNHNNISLEILDIAEQGLPLHGEPVVPSLHPADNPTPHYIHAHTRAWFTKIRQFDASNFVTPQYNWSVPASLKNALDYLYHEWKGKPAAVISYGGRGGGKCADHLLTGIIPGLRMKPVLNAVALRTSVGLLEETVKLGRISDGLVGEWRWGGVEEAIRRMFWELVDALEASALNNTNQHYRVVRQGK